MASDNSHIAGLALRYANAIFELADEERGLDQIETDFVGLKAMLKESPELTRLVRSPLFSRDEQARGMEAVLARAAASALTRKLVLLLANHIGNLEVLREALSAARASTLDKAARG